VVLLILIPRPVKRAALLFDLLRLLVLEYARLDSTLPSTQETLLECFRGVSDGVHVVVWTVRVGS
jgi:hypothetical protein